MGISKPWSEMSVDEKLDTLKHEVELNQRQAAATAKALDEVRRRTQEVERRLEESLLDQALRSDRERGRAHRHRHPCQHHACFGEPGGGDQGAGRRRRRHPGADPGGMQEAILGPDDHPMTNVVVRNGVVELWGTITDERERQALIVVSENVPGVKTVHDHLVWIEPNSGFVIQSEEDEARARAS
jgi:hypothetical protein